MINILNLQNFIGGMPLNTESAETNTPNSIEFDNDTLRAAVNLWFDNREEAIRQYGDINTWNVSQVTNMSSLFNDRRDFNDDISNWDVGNVTNMYAMFWGASAFNQPLEQWNVSTVTDMGYMFHDASAFNQPLEQWNVSNVTNMSLMFSFAIAFNQDIRHWDITNVRNIENMFREATDFRQRYPEVGLNIRSIFFKPLNDETVRKAVNLWSGSYTEAKGKYGDISRWNVSKVTNMSKLFQNQWYFNDDISNWDVGNVTDMDSMFRDAQAFDQPIGRWNVSNVTNMQNMFWFASTFNQPLEQWNVSNVTNMRGMFRDASVFNQPLANWEREDSTIENVTNMNSMFQGARSFNQPLEQWNVGNVTNMQGMFNKASAFNQPLGEWDVRNVTDMEAMFLDAISFSQPLGQWNVGNMTRILAMFDDATAFLQRYPNADNDPRSVFTSTETNTQNSIVFNNKTLRGAVFLWVNNRDEAFSLYEDINTWNVSQVTDMNNLFNNRRDFNDDISNWDVSNVENMENMFFNASSFDQNIGRWDVSKVTNMDSMFKGATSFNQNINTKIASRTNYIYGNEPVSIESYIAWDVSKVTNMNSMFERAISFNQDMTGFNVNNDVTMIKMFSESPLQNEYTATPTKEQFIGIKIKSYYPKFNEKTIEENRQYFKYKHKNNFDIGMLYNGDIVSFIENNQYDINELTIEGGIKSIDDLIEMDKRDESVSYASISKEFFHVKIFYEFVKNLNPSDNEFMIDGLITYLCFEFINYIQNPVFLLYLKF
ncbi:MAG: BspA family leucine-rich repeat surface protein, partial [Asgard group archaeon]|nr:BspA family leucine-rich repeat surface protein [Asgard group archaeon]